MVLDSICGKKVVELSLHMIWHMFSINILLV